MWAATARRHPGWPQQSLLTPQRERVWFDLAAHTPSFQADIAAFREWMAGNTVGSPFRGLGHRRALRETTIRTRLAGVRYATAALVANGTPLDTITGLDCLVTPEAVETILTHYWNRTREQRQSAADPARREHVSGHSATLQSIGETLIVIAHYRGVSSEELSDIKDLVKDIRCPKQHGLTKKNRDRLRQFEDDQTLALLLALPRRLMGDALKKREYARANNQPLLPAARLARAAITIAILLRIPLRIRNLHAIQIGTHLKFSGERSDVVTLGFQAHETKNWEELEFYVGARLVELLRLYIAWFLPALSAQSPDFAENRWLFPAGGDRPGPLQIDSLRQIIEETVEEGTGAKIHPHLFRALAVRIHLRRSPGALEHCRKLLGDRTLEVVLAYYASLSGREASEAQDKLVDAEEARLAGLLEKSGRRGAGR